MQTEKRLNEGIWRWYEFKKDASVFFARPGEPLQGQYDYIVALDFPLCLQNPSDFIKELKSHLKSSGTMLLGVDNSLGYRYFCGDIHDPAKKQFTKCMVKNMLCSAGIKSYKFYSVLPSLDAAQLIYADSFVPTENLSIRYLPLYNNPESVFKVEELGYGDLIENGLFHSMANSFLVECNDEGNFNAALQVTLSCDRGVSRAFATIIKDGGVVVKKALFEQGCQNLVELQKNLLELKELGIKVVDGRLSDFSFEMPFVSAPLANVYLQNLARTDKNLFIEKMDRFVELVFKSAKRGVCYFDFVPLNAFYDGNDFVFFDQEFCLDAREYPVGMVVYRSILIVYSGCEKINSKVPPAFFFDRYGIAKDLSRFGKKSHDFLMALRNQYELSDFNEKHQRNDSVVRFNAEHIRTTHFYDELLTNGCFERISGKNVCVFGSGKYAEKFFSLKKSFNFSICGVVDNDSKKWGGDFHGLKIESPQSLLEIARHKKACDAFCVVICAKDFKPIYSQLFSMNIRDIVLFTPEKYRVGYLSGVFDLYHIGHINMFRRAKEQCDYLIVGVTSDEYVRNKKKREPFIPFDERLAVVASCKYVDEAVKVPYMHEEISEAWETYHYDIQFCGSDYEHHPWWLAQQKWLREHGADLVFFPYTEQTSSTKIKALIEKGLL